MMLGACLAVWLTLLCLSFASSSVIHFSFSAFLISGTSSTSMAVCFASWPYAACLVSIASSPCCHCGVPAYHLLARRTTCAQTTRMLSAQLFPIGRIVHTVRLFCLFSVETKVRRLLCLYPHALRVRTACIVISNPQALTLSVVFFYSCCFSNESVLLSFCYSLCCFQSFLTT